jgi:integrase
MKGVYQKGPYWYARIDGREVSCGKGEKGREMAEAARAKDIVKQYEHKEVNAGLKVKRPQFKTVREMINWFMLLPSTQNLASYPRKVSASVHVLDYFGGMSPGQVDSEDQERYRMQRDVSDATVNLEIALLSVAYNKALKAKKITRDAMPGEFVFVNCQNPRLRVTDDDFERMLKFADDDFKDMMVCAWESAMRQGEIRKLTAGKVKLDIQHISGKKVSYIDLGPMDTKNRTRRVVPVSARLKVVLEQRLKGLGPDDLVFTNEGKKFTALAVRYKMIAVCNKADVVYGDRVFNDRGERIGITFHCFRHSRVSKWVEMGYSDEIIRRASGHKSLAAYQNYVKLDPAVICGLVENGKNGFDENAIKSPQASEN